MQLSFIHRNFIKCMTMSEPLLATDLPSLKLVHQGKVRDIYAVDDASMLMVSTDRLSAFDVILPNGIAYKGAMLTQMANFWFGQLADVIPNHLTGIDPQSVVSTTAEKTQLDQRAVVVKKLKPLPLEAIVRGYITGSGWKEYQANGTVCGIALPEGLQEAQQLEVPIFTPSSKAEVGGHDENITLAQAAELVGKDMLAQIVDASLALYNKAAAFALTKGIIIADTKFEFGLDEAGVLHVMDEVLTPDSSRFWPVDQYQVGTNPPSFDKQFVRDWLQSSGWDKLPPAPELPAEIAIKTSEKYQEAYQRLTGQSLAE